MNAAPAHLEAKLRFWEFSVAQLAAVFAGLLLGLAWGEFLCPVRGMWAAMSAAYVAALPVIPVIVASQTEFDLCALVLGAWRWRRREGRYLPGPGGEREAYVVASDAHETERDGVAMLDLAALWEQS